MTFCEECGQQMPNYCDDCGKCLECCRCWDEPTEEQIQRQLNYTPPEPFTMLDKDDP